MKELTHSVQDNVAIIPFDIFRKKVLSYLSGLYADNCNSKDEDSIAVCDTVEIFQRNLLVIQSRSSFLEVVKKEIAFFDPVFLPYTDKLKGCIILVCIGTTLYSLWDLFDGDIDNLNKKSDLDLKVY